MTTSNTPAQTTPATAAPASTTPATPVADTSQAAAGTTPNPGVEGTGTTPAAPAVTAPEKYEAFKLPEGFALPEGFEGFAREKGFSQDQAQAFIDRLDAHGKASAEAATKAAKDKQEADTIAMRAKWETDLRASPKFGGEKFDENVAVALTGRDKLAPPEMVAFLNETGFGNHPIVFEHFHTLGKLVQSGRILSGETVPDTRDPLRAMYKASPELFKS